MKKNLFMLAAVAFMSFTACNKEEVSVENPVDNQTPAAVVEFTASFATTKTALDNVGSKTLWVESDRIDINGQEFEIKELINGGLSAKFQNVDALPVDFEPPFTAKYPYGVTEVPAAQTAKAGTFDPAAVLETAESNDYTLSFENVTSLLKFQVEEACETVTITSSDALAGSSAKTVTVTGPFETGNTYYAAVLPGEKADFVVRMDGYLSRNAASVTVGESTIANMGTLPAPEIFDWGIVGQHQGWDITAPTAMYKVANNVYACLGIQLKDNGFKFAKYGLENWNTANTHFGAYKDFSEPYKVTDWYTVYTNNLGDQNKNLGVSDWSKKYDIYVKVVQDAGWGQELAYNVVTSGTSLTF